LLTEDKKAYKKSNKYKNKVRFRLENEFNSANESKNEDAQLNESKIEEMTFNDKLKSNTRFDLITNSLEKKKMYMNSMIKSNKISLSSKLIDSSNPYELNTKIFKLKDNNELNNIFSNHEYCSIPDTVSENAPTPILRVFLENQTIKSFKYDNNTSVRDVLNCLKEKLNINFIEYFGLVIKLNNENIISKFVLLEETRHLFKLKEEFGDESNYQCMLRFVFIPSSYKHLIENDANSFNYLYEQVSQLQKVFKTHSFKLKI
jgi:hypothetical protein